jgi:hypothetical protein
MVRDTHHPDVEEAQLVLSALLLPEDLGRCPTPLSGAGSGTGEVVGRDVDAASQP